MTLTKEPATPGILKAWLGYKSDGRGGFLIRICCRCPDKMLAEKQAAADGFGVSHTLCQSHYQEELKKLGIE